VFCFGRAGSINKQFGIRIVDGTTGREYFLSAPSTEDCTAWFDALTNVPSTCLVFLFDSLSDHVSIQAETLI
jgi:hypothetical protein